MRYENDDFVPVTRSAPLKDADVRADFDTDCGLKGKSDIDLHLVRLLKLHSSVKVQFRNQDLASLDDATKRDFVSDVGYVLGIKPLKTRQK